MADVGMEEIKRLCAYLKNDSLIRWKLGCSQASIDEARASLARVRTKANGYGYLPPSALSNEESEEKRRAKRAAAGNKAYLRAVARVAG